MKAAQSSFSAGEVTPELYGNAGVEQYPRAVALMENFLALPHGPAARRPGTLFTAQCKSDTTAVRLIPYVGIEGGGYEPLGGEEPADFPAPSESMEESSSSIAAETAMLIEFGDYYIRFHSEAGPLLGPTVARNITQTDTDGTIHVSVVPVDWVDGLWVYFDGDAAVVPTLSPSLSQMYILSDVVVGTPGTVKLKRPSLTSVYLDTPSVVGIPSGKATLRKVYELSTIYPAADLAALRYTQSPNFMTFTHPSHPIMELRRTSTGTWSWAATSFTPTLAAPTGLAIATTPVSPPSTATPQSYVVTALAADLVTESLPSAAVATSNDLSQPGAYNTVSFTPTVGSVRTRVYKRIAGVYGFLGETTGTSIIDDNLLPDNAVTPPGSNITFNDAATHYPQAVTHYEQRRMFAASIQKPATVWATRNGTDSNMTSSVPSREDDALQFTVASQQKNEIMHLLGLTEPVALTRGGAYRIFADGGLALAFNTVRTKPQGYSGASLVTPVVAPGSAFYVQAQGSRIREIAYQPDGTGIYRTADVMLLAPHLTEGHIVVALAYVHAPEQYLWAVRDDGVLLGLTHAPDQSVYGWHRHSTNGLVKSVATLPGNGEDALYMVVQRATGGPYGKTVQYIERLTRRVIEAVAEEAFFVDAGYQYSGAAVSVIPRLWHLEGREVTGLADGAVIPPQFVANGQITLTGAVTDAVLGLAYSSRLQTLPAVTAAPNGGRGEEKSTTQVDVRVHRSAGFEVGQTFDDMYAYPDRETGEPTDLPPPLRSTSLRVPVGLGWDVDGFICIRQDAPLPCTVLAIVPTTEEGD